MAAELPPSDDQREIERVLVGYVRLFDSGQTEAAVDLFTEDGTLTTSATEPVRGREALRTFVGRARDARREAGQQPRHIVSNVAVTVDGDTAEAHSYLTLVITDAEGSVSIAATGQYDDRLVRTADGWRLAQRHLAFDRDGR